MPVPATWTLIAVGILAVNAIGGTAATAYLLDARQGVGRFAGEFDRLMGIHATAAFLGARTAARHMTAGGSIVMISSINGFLGFGERAAYCAAKAA